MRFVLVVLFLLLTLSIGQAIIYPDFKSVSGILGQSGNGTIFYQTSANEFIEFGNVLNPIKVSVIYGIGSVNYPAHICLNPFGDQFTISGVHMATTCPAGALGYATNTSTIPLPNQKETDIQMKSADVYSTETSPASIYTKPNGKSQGSFVVTIPASEATQQFSLSAEWYECGPELYPVGSMNECVNIPVRNTSFTDTVQILSGGWQYFQIPTPIAYDSTYLNAFTVAFNQSDSQDLELYVQQGYYPTREWHLNAEYQYDEDNELSSATVWTPTGTYFIGIYNSGTSNQNINLAVNSSTCATGFMGYACQVSNPTDPVTPFNSIFPLSAAVDLSDPTGNNGTALSYDFSGDDDTGLAYFKLTNYPIYSGNLYVRVSVANNDISDPNGAPALFAKKGSLPSEQSNHLNVSTIGDVSHQIVVPITYDENITPPETWYIAVKIPADFSIWVGVNCANNCSNGKHGTCYCGSETCMDLTNNGANLEPLYALPSSILDSGGSCNCDDVDYSQSYDCTEKNDGLVGVYLLLFGILVLFVIVIAVAIPLGCMVYKKKNSRYLRENINYETI